MKRTLGTFVGVAGLLALGACKNAPKDPIKLVPDQATMIAGVDIKGLTGTKLYEKSQDELKNGDPGKALEAAKACNLGPDKFKAVYLGIDPASENLALVVNADGVGKEDNLTCIHDKIKESEGTSPWTMEEKDGKKVLSIQGGTMTGYAVADDILAIASQGWVETLKELMAGKGKPAVDNSLKDLYAKAPKDKHLWFAGNLPQAAKSELAGTPGEKVETVVGGLDFSQGLAIALAAGVAGGAPEAKKLQDELQKQFDQVKGMGVVLGVPQGVVDSVKIGSEDAAVTLEARISESDMDAIENSLKGMMTGGAPGIAMPPPDAPDPAMEGPGGEPALGGEAAGEPGAAEPAQGAAAGPAGEPAEELPEAAADDPAAP